MTLARHGTSWLLLGIAASALGAITACGDSSTGPSGNEGRIAIGDTVAGSIAPGGDPLVFTFTAQPGQMLAAFLHTSSGAANLAILAPDAVTMALVGDAARDGALEERASAPFPIASQGVHVVRVAAFGAAGADFRFRLSALASIPERREQEIELGSIITGEDLETQYDVDDFTFDGQQGDELIGYIRALAPHPRAIVVMRVVPEGGDPDWGAFAVASSDSVAAELEARPTGRFILPWSGRYVVSMKIVRTHLENANVAGYPRGYEFLLRRVSRAPESVGATLTPGDTIQGEAIDFIGDVDEYTIAAPAGGEFNLFLQRSGATTDGVVAGVLGVDETWDHSSALAQTPGALLRATATGRFRIDAGQTMRVIVRGGSDREGGYRAPYRLFLYEVERAPEIASATVTLGDTIEGETIELPGDADEFVLTVPEQSLANFVIWSEEGATPDAARLQVLDQDGEPTGHGTVLMSGTGRAQATGTFELAAGTYTLRVGGEGTKGDGFLGGYRAHLYAIDPAPETWPSALAYGARVDAALEPPGDHDTFTFSGRRDHHVSVRLESSGEPLPRLTTVVFNARTNWPLSDAWYGTPGVPRYDLPESGDYRILVLPMNGGRLLDEHGPYRLVLDTVPTVPEHHGTTLVPGDSVVDEQLDFNGDVDAFVLTGTPGQELTVHFITPNLGGPGVTLELHDLESGERVDSVKSAGLLQSSGLFTLPASGRLGARVYQPNTSPFSSGVTGPYRIIVLPIDRRPESVASAIQVGDTVEGEAIDPDADIDEFTFAGASGERVEIHFQTPLGTWRGWEGLVLELLAPTGATLGSVTSLNPTDRLEDQSTGEIVLPTAGTYMVRVRAGMDWYGGGEYRFRVVRIP